MIELPVYNQHGEKVDTFALDESALGGEVRPALLKQAYVRQHANRRQASARTKSRGMVAGSTRKLYRQKGTGNARMGTVRTVIRRGGGVAFAKTRDSFRQDMPKKMRRLANRNALLAKAVDDEIRVIDSLELEQPRTRDFKALLGKMNVDRSCLVALDDAQQAAARSARNLPDVDTIRWRQLNVFELLNHRYLVIDRASLQAWIDEAHHAGRGSGRAAAGNRAAVTTGDGSEEA